MRVVNNVCPTLQLSGHKNYNFPTTLDGQFPEKPVIKSEQLQDSRGKMEVRRFIPCLYSPSCLRDRSQCTQFIFQLTFFMLIYILTS